MDKNIKEQAAKGILWGGIFSFFQQFIGILFSIIIARLLSPDDYGMIGLLSIFTTLAVAIQESGFVLALTNKKEITCNEYSTIFWVNLLISIFVYIVLYIFAPTIAIYFKEPELTQLSRYLFCNFVISSISIVQNIFLFKNLKVKEKGIANALALIISGFVGIYMAMNGYRYWGIATQSIVSSIIYTIIIWVYSPFRPSFCFQTKFVKTIIIDSINFSIPNIFAVLSDNVYSIILGKFYSTKELGLYGQSTKYNTLGYSVILGMIRNVSQPLLVQYTENKELLLIVFRKLFKFTAYISIPTMLGLSMIAPDLIKFLLTEKWEYSGYILRVLSISGIFIIQSTLFTYLIVSLNKSSTYMYLGILNSIIKLIIAFIASFWGIIYLAIATVIMEFLGFIFNYLIVRHYCRYTIKDIITDLYPILFISFLSLLISYLTIYLINNSLILLLIRILSAIIVYIILSSIFHISSYEYIKTFIIDKFIMHNSNNLRK